MEEIYSIPLSQLAQEFSLEPIVIPENYESIMITSPEISRPGLALAGFFEIFEEQRIQLIGNAEHRYLEELEPEERRRRIERDKRRLRVAVTVTVPGAGKALSSIAVRESGRFKRHPPGHTRPG